MFPLSLPCNVFIYIIYVITMYYVGGSVFSCGTGTYGLRVVVAVLPAWWRFAQCLRRYYDTKDVNPHLINAGKYSTAFFVVTFSAVASTVISEWRRRRLFLWHISVLVYIIIFLSLIFVIWYKVLFCVFFVDDSLSFLQQSKLYLIIFCFWMVSAIVSTSYTFSWDILMDWSLFPNIPKRCCRRKSLKLRDERIYTYKVKYFSIYLSLAAHSLSSPLLPPPTPFLTHSPSLPPHSLTNHPSLTSLSLHYPCVCTPCMLSFLLYVSFITAWHWWKTFSSERCGYLTCLLVITSLNS